MAFTRRAKLVRSFEDSQLNWEGLQTYTDSVDTTLASTATALARLNETTPVTALPGGTPVDGQLITFDPSGWTVTGTVDTRADVLWLLQYRTSTGKWHFLGGDPLIAKVDTAEGKGVTGYTVALTTSGPAITCAVAGDFIVQVGALINGIAAFNGQMSYVTTVAAVDADSAYVNVAGAGGVNAVSPPHRKTMTAAGAFGAQYKGNAGTTVFSFRWISVLPVRLG